MYFHLHGAKKVQEHPADMLTTDKELFLFNAFSTTLKRNIYLYEFLNI